METIYGTWDGTDIYLNESSKWVNITQYPYTQFGFSIRFSSDKKFYGTGYFGYGGGTYEAMGNTVYTYIDGKEYARYIIKSLNNNTAELTMHMGSSNIDIRVKKR